MTFALPTPANSAMDKQRENGALLISACFIAAIRLRGEPIQQSPKVVATVPYSLPEWCCSDWSRGRQLGRLALKKSVLIH